ncbi:MAG: ribonuclease P protein component [Phocaeicola sp.]|uniref:ribonuclease P protein component n=1 Tax=Phocaeicola TaxID=909656 RepID=UPI00234EC356|nr:ribonuclease P protein component [Phocaeicola oris]MCE2616762.1 ribonuclease P protein component [Phocaeicola oris]
MEEKPYTLQKSERLNSKLLMDSLFMGGSKSFPSFPLRVVYKWIDTQEGRSDASILISVSKKYFKRAVKRNRVKRQVREAYRKHKHLLLDKLAEKDKQIIIAFIWLDDKLHSTKEVDAKVERLLQFIADSV